MTSDMRIILLTFFIFISTQAVGDEIILNLYSHHYNKLNSDTEFNNKNFGVGYKKNNVTVGFFRNSFYETVEQRTTHAISPYISVDKQFRNNIGLSLTLSYYNDDGKNVYRVVGETNGFAIIPMLSYTFKSLMLSTNAELIHISYRYEL